MTFDTRSGTYAIGAFRTSSPPLSTEKVNGTASPSMLGPTSCFASFLSLASLSSLMFHAPSHLWVNHNVYILYDSTPPQNSQFSPSDWQVSLHGKNIIAWNGYWWWNGWFQQTLPLLLCQCLHFKFQLLLWWPLADQFPNLLYFCTSPLESSVRCHAWLYPRSSDPYKGYLL